MSKLKTIKILVIAEARFMLWIMLVIHNYLFMISHLNDILLFFSSLDDQNGKKGRGDKY